MTEAFRQALVESGGAWVVRGDDGLRNGLDGRRLEDFTDAFRFGAPTSVADVAVGFLRPQAPTADQLVVSASVRHRAAEETVLGTTSELLATELAGAPPSGWGTHEPAGRPWDRHALTQAARDRMPEPTRLLVVGSAAAPVALTVTAQRTEQGVEELTTGLLSAGVPGDPVTEMRIAAVPQVLGRLAVTQLPLFALVLRRPGGPTSRRRRGSSLRRSRSRCCSGRPRSGSSASTRTSCATGSTRWWRASPGSPRSCCRSVAGGTGTRSRTSLP
ncbi:DUF6177 family protein [Curtobacterium flaccumfaciens]|nr:DUF6177 family protein [Curtobacterium flaccumfaciens]